MSNISASEVKILREKTGAGMMECKKALVEAEGNMEKAEDIIAKSGLRKAQKTASRTAAEGVVLAFVAPDNKSGTIIEVNCETDFVARDENFKAFCSDLMDCVNKNQIEDIEAIHALKLANNSTIEDSRKALIAKIGENIQVRRAKCFQSDTGLVAAYSHDGRMATLVKVTGQDATLARDLAMHITAMKPAYIKPEEVPQELVAKEKEIFQALSKDSGKPANIVEKIIEGQLNKFLADICLLGQSFVKNPDKKISQLLKEHNTEILSMARFVVGEGIEVEKKNFHEEVMAQVKRS